MTNDFFKKNNRWWEARSKIGRNLIFSTPADLWLGFTEWVEWVEDNPIVVGVKEMIVGEDIVQQDVTKPRPMTLSGLSLFLGVPLRTWISYRNREEYKDVCQAAEAVIYDQKLSLAMVNSYNSNIVIRDLGLTDKQDIKQSGGLDNTWRINIVKPVEIEMKEIKHEPQGSQASQASDGKDAKD